MKLPPITGTIHEVRKVEKRKNGFNQIVIIHKAQVNNEQGYKLSKEQFYVVQIYSNKADDSRFIPEVKMKDAIGAACTANVRMDASRWTNNHGTHEYNTRLNLESWQS
jgi:hypothetical protein